MQLTAMCCCLERLLPAFPRNQTALGVEVEKDIVEPVLTRPQMQRRRGVVRARMADEQT